VSRGRVLGALLATALLVSGCGGGSSPTVEPTPSSSATTSPSSSPSAGACDAVTTRLLASVQRYVDGYGATLSRRPASGSSSDTGDDAELRATLQQAQTDLASNACDQAAFRKDFAAGLQQVTADGPLARAVLLRLTASMTGTLSSTPQTVSVATGADLARSVASLAPGSTVRLAAGAYLLRQPLVLLAGVTLVGAGRDRTTITSPAAGSAVLVLNDARTELRDLTLRHTGDRPASVLVGGPSSFLVLTDARISGGRTTRGASDPGAGSGVAMTSRSGDATPRGTTLQVTRTAISGNQAAGVLATGAHRVSIRASQLSGNGQCGVCFSGASGGAVRGSTLRDDAVGIAVFDTAKPLLQGLTVQGGQVGVQATGSAAPTIKGITVTAPSRAGLIYSEKANGRLDDATCARAPYGIVVGPSTYPLIGTTSCTVAKGR
jgi:hypothetical protein